MNTFASLRNLKLSHKIIIALAAFLLVVGGLGYRYRRPIIRRFRSHVDFSHMSRQLHPATHKMLAEVSKEVGDPRVKISRGKATPEDQARAMIKNIKRTGKKAQLDVYRSSGRAVIRCYDARLSEQENVRRMVEEMEYQGYENVSKHLSTDPYLEVFDIALASITDTMRYRAALEQRGCRVLEENGCFHVEWKRPKQ